MLLADNRCDLGQVCAVKKKTLNPEFRFTVPNFDN